MKIVGKTRSGYLMEIGTCELDEITGCGCRHENRLQIGSEFTATKSFRHLESIRYAAEQRKNMATQLRAMAEMIEIIPDAMEIPEPPKAVETEGA